MLMGPDLKVSQGVQRPLEARLRSVAYGAMAYWYYEWDWGEAIAYDGIDAARAVLSERAFDDFLAAGVQRWSEAFVQSGVASRMGPVACAARRLKSDEDLRPPLVAYAASVCDSPRAKAGAYLLDHPSPMVFVDTLYSEPPALVMLAEVLDRPDLIARAVELCLGHVRALQDGRTGLFRHCFDTSNGDSPDILWGRGNGWAFLGLADLLIQLPGTAAPPSLEAEVREVHERFLRACEGLVATEVAGGGWRNLMNDEASSPESSTTALIAAALLIALRAGVLEADRYHSLALRAWRSIEHRIDANGHLMGVSFRPGINKDPARYEHVPLVGSYPWGQGAYLRAASAWWALDRSWTAREGGDTR